MAEIEKNWVSGLTEFLLLFLFFFFFFLHFFKKKDFSGVGLEGEWLVIGSTFWQNCTQPLVVPTEYDRDKRSATSLDLRVRVIHNEDASATLFRRLKSL